MSDYLKKAELWTGDGFDEITREEVRKMMKNDPKELEDSFYKDLDFGTGGLRGIMGAGSNRINNYTISMATQGLANYIQKNFPNEEVSVAIAHDCRNNSHLFARKTAEVFAANGIKVYLYPDLRSTPQLSYTIRHLGCKAGVVITASHNPKEYNGYKVYWEDGAQIIAPHDKNIITEVRKITSPSMVATKVKDELIEIVSSEIDKEYRKTVLGLIKNKGAIKQEEDINIVFTALHGTGITQIPDLLADAGFKNVFLVESQSKPDGNFPTVESPNPEEKAALAKALKLGIKKNAEIILGTDPDADRVGIAVRDLNNEFILLNGNEAATLLVYYSLSQMNKEIKDPFICKTIVTTELLDRIAEGFSIPCYNTLTGFKYIAEKIRELEGKKQFIAGGEESYGYLIGDFVRDKDANSAALVFCEIAAWAKNKGSSFYKELIEIYVKFGFYKEALVSITKKGKSGAEEISAIMESFRKAPPQEIAGSKVLRIADYFNSVNRDIQNEKEEKIELEKSNVLQFFLDDGSKITARPSGTEPKIKFYFSVNAKLNDKSEFDAKSGELQNRLDQLIEAVSKY